MSTLPLRRCIENVHLRTQQSLRQPRNFFSTVSSTCQIAPPSNIQISSKPHHQLSRGQYYFHTFSIPTLPKRSFRAVSTSPSAGIETREYKVALATVEDLVKRSRRVNVHLSTGWIVPLIIFYFCEIRITVDFEEWDDGIKEGKRGWKRYEIGMGKARREEGGGAAIFGTVTRNEEPWQG